LQRIYDPTFTQPRTTQHFDELPQMPITWPMHRKSSQTHPSSRRVSNQAHYIFYAQLPAPSTVVPP